MSDSLGKNILRLRGLPWQATRENVVSFFSDCNISGGVNGVYMTLSSQGRPSGEAYVEMESSADAARGLEKHKKVMGTRYIEVFTSNRKEMDYALRKNGSTKIDIDPALDGFVRLRGLPFDCNEEDIQNFFQGLSIVRDGIVLPIDHQGRSSGEAYVQFATREIAEKAMGKHKEKIGHRYIEIFKSSPHEFLAVRNQQPGGYIDQPVHSGRGGGAAGGYSGDNYNSYDAPFPPSKRNYYLSSNRSVPYDKNYNNRGSGHWGGGSSRPPLSELGFRKPYSSTMDDYGSRGSNKRFVRRESDSDSAYRDKYQSSRHVVHMRGLPYKATEEDIHIFFQPYVPIFIQILFDDLGRPSGEADVEFSTHEEALGAMSKDKSNMELRYIELFLRSRPASAGDLPPPLPIEPVSPLDHPSSSSRRYSYSTPQPVAPPNYSPNSYSGITSGGHSGSLRSTTGYGNSAPPGSYRMGSMGMREHYLSERTK